MNHWENMKLDVVRKRYTELIDKNTPNSDLRIMVASLEHELDLANLTIDKLKEELLESVHNTQA